MKAIGIILAGGNSRRIRDLSAKRAVAAMPIGGNYRSIDFSLSNMTNSGIQTVAIITQYNTRSLNQHLNSSKWWNFGRKQGGMYLFTPTITMENSDWFRGTADSIYQNIDFLKNRHEPYVVIADADIVYKMDFNLMLDYHIAKRADITVLCKEMPADCDVSRYGVVQMDENNRILEFEEKPLVTNLRTISAGVYVIRRRQLIELLERANEEGHYDLVNDILIRYRHVKKIYGYPLESYWSNISDIRDYYRTNMDFLQKNIRDYFREVPRIHSRIIDLPPAKFNPGSDISGALIASGCIINGRVEHSILFPQVFIGKNCTIRNCIIMSNVHIGENTFLENCIVESGSTIKPNSRYVGEEKIEVVSVTNNRYLL